MMQSILLIVVQSVRFGHRIRPNKNPKIRPITEVESRCRVESCSTTHEIDLPKNEALSTILQ